MEASLGPSGLSERAVAEWEGCGAPACSLISMGHIDIRDRRMTTAAEPQAASERETIVFFHAHPDDEAIFSGGTIARLAGVGHRVVVVMATSGGQGRSIAASIDDATAPTVS